MKICNCGYETEKSSFKFCPLCGKPLNILEMEPTLNPNLLGGIYSPRDKQCNQFILVSAFAENAAENGVEFVLDCAVTGMDVKDGKIHAVHTTGPSHGRIRECSAGCGWWRIRF